ncbi:hypothetical protein KJZ71_02070 [Patescibacteria group bacterium]|uniref:Uncharacterized protein n=1 Tax=candidate division WWE3 bacterium TaxID=2053526 RepID=A0A928TVT5_UNCKA|nr:hypothetical protein [candidate division WWE3 bacterium]MCL4732573.1 hypothetical protein [Patescibacteria group bacterium]MDL1953238.1 hypothetical protein [Candidatus Uhrbacteria bacterium UHB]RIL00957.1 MAG: hypothetical protein DCC77_00220 [Candidatus Uhrbacteria bacterium]
MIHKKYPPRILSFGGRETRGGGCDFSRDDPLKVFQGLVDAAGEIAHDFEREHFVIGCVGVALNFRHLFPQRFLFSLLGSRRF